jgi:WD40 repeat protein
MHRTKKRVIGDDFNKIREYPAMSGRIHTIAFHPDGKEFAAGSSLDGKGQVWVYETATAKVVSKLECEFSAIFTLAYSPDGKQIASAGFDGMVRLSDPSNGKVIKEFVGVPLATAKSEANR